MKAIVGKRYRHYKGNEYTVLAIARLESDPNEVYVVYRAEYTSPDFGEGTVWLRKQEFFEEQIIVSGTSRDRFTQI
jgi:hypothetical protein